MDEQKCEVTDNSKDVTPPSPPSDDTKPPEKRIVAPPKGLSTTETGVIALRSIDEQMMFAQRLIQEKMISETFKTPQQVVIGFQYAKALNLPEILALKMMYVVNGKPSLYAEGPLSLVQRASSYHKIREYFINENGEEISPKNKNLKGAVYFGSVTEIWRKGDNDPQIDFFTEEDLARAGLNLGRNGEKEVWAKWKRIMFRYKGRTLALRSKFADLIAGIPVAEYDFDFTPEIPDMKPVRDVKSSVADEINKGVLGEEKTGEGQEATQLN